MDEPELRQRLRAIVGVEESGDWNEVERLSYELKLELLDPGFHVAEIANHYLDDVEIRERDSKYAASQRDELERFIETGEDRTIYMPRWTCGAVILLIVVVLAVWLAI